VLQNVTGQDQVPVKERQRLARYAPDAVTRRRAADIENETLLGVQHMFVRDHLAPVTTMVQNPVEFIPHAAALQNAHKDAPTLGKAIVVFQRFVEFPRVPRLERIALAKVSFASIIIIKAL
jgi:hypothetical protein